MNNDFNQDYLMHYGVLGMKWGVRRYQNEDGSLTPRGQKRYYGKKSINKLERKAIKKDRREIEKLYYTKRDAEIKEYYNKASDYADKKGLDYDDIIDDRNEYVKSAKARGVDRQTIADVIEYNKLLSFAEAKEQEIQSKYYKKIENDLIKKYGNESVSKALYGHSATMDVGDSDSSVTRRVKENYNNMSEQEFRRKYGVTKKTYANRVDKYGDPYMNSPLAKFAKSQAKKASSQKKEPIVKNQKSNESNNETLSDKFDKAKKDNPSITYATIYKEMGVNMRSEDPDDYRYAEAEWYKKHGY